MDGLRNLVPIVVILLAAIVAGAPAAAQAIDASPPDIRDELEEIPPVPVEPAPGLPRPVDPVIAPTAETSSFRLVGFTAVSLPANRGILNYTLACQREFSGSRICTMSEVAGTLSVPAPPGYGHAWVRAATGRDDVPAWFGPEDSRPRELRVLPNDCNGWTTDSPLALGTAMDLGRSPECYGGFHAVSCDRSLAVACCAPPAVATD